MLVGEDRQGGGGLISSYCRHITINAWFCAISANCSVDFSSVCSDFFEGSPLDIRNCLTVEALMPKFTFSGNEPMALAIFSLSSCEMTTPTMLPPLS